MVKIKSKAIFILIFVITLCAVIPACRSVSDIDGNLEQSESDTTEEFTDIFIIPDTAPDTVEITDETETEKADEAEETAGLEPETEPKTEPVTEPKTEPVTEPKTEPVTEPKTEPVTELKTEPVTELKTEPKTEPETEPKTEPETEPKTEPKTEPETNASDFNPLVLLTDRADETFFDDVLFFGDSQVICIDNYAVIPNAEYIGINGVNTYRVVTQTIKTNKGNMSHEDLIAEYNRKNLYILLGQNDLEWLEIPRFIGYYSEFIGRVREKSPDKTIFIISVLPVVKDYTGFSYEIVDDYNEALYEMCENLGIYYINLWEILIDGDLSLDISLASSDGVHMRSNGYAAAADYLYTHYIK